MRAFSYLANSCERGGNLLHNDQSNRPASQFTWYKATMLENKSLIINFYKNYVIIIILFN